MQKIQNEKVDTKLASIELNTTQTLKNYITLWEFDTAKSLLVKDVMEKVSGMPNAAEIREEHQQIKDSIESLEESTREHLRLKATVEQVDSREI